MSNKLPRSPPHAHQTAHLMVYFVVVMKDSIQLFKKLVLDALSVKYGKAKLAKLLMTKHAKDSIIGMNNLNAANLL